MKKQKVSIFWFRRDLRLEDNRGLFEAFKSSCPVLPLFIFDTNIIDELEPSDSRISFIYDRLSVISDKLGSINSSLYCKGSETIWKNIFKDFDVQDVYANEDYEPYAIQRDKNIELLLTNYGVKLNLYKDQVIFCKEEILKADKTPYTVFTPYKNKWLKRFSEEQIHNYSSESGANFLKENFPLPSLSNLGFKRSSIKVVNYKLDHLVDYEKNRNIPALNRTSYLSPHLRFGTVSIRQVVQKTFTNQAFLNELIWRDFFMQILLIFLMLFNQILEVSTIILNGEIIWKNLGNGKMEKLDILWLMQECEN